MAAALLSLLMVIGLTMGPGRCQNSPASPGPCFGDDSYFANIKPNSNIIKPVSVTTKLTESACVNKCFNSPSCSSIFFEKTSGICNLYDTVFAVKERLVPSPNTSHFRIVSDERCPIEKCYYMSRNYGLCLSFSERTSRRTYNYTASKQLCEDNHGRLSILDTKNKSLWVARMIQANTRFPGGQYRSYIGARATNSTSYSWSNGQAVAREGERESFWKPGSADSHVGEPCIHLIFSGLQPSGAWENTHCNFTVNNVVCEFVP